MQMSNIRTEREKQVKMGGKKAFTGMVVLPVLIIIIMIAANIAVCQARSGGQKIYINKIRVSESRVLATEEIRKITAGYEGKTVSIDKLRGLVAAINKLYTDRGYITARAILPEQKVTDGVVEIELVEGSIGEIVLRGNRNTVDDYILKRISYNTGDIIKLDRLQRELFYFNATNDIRLRADLEAGQDYGTTDLILKVKEPRKMGVTLFNDNAGRSETGLYRCGLRIANSSLSGYRDSLNLMVFTGEGSEGGTLSYSLPVSRRGTRFVLSYNNNVTDIISGEYESVEIASDYREYGAGFSSPLKIREGFKVDGSLEYHRKISDTFFSGAKLLTTDVETYQLGLSTRAVTENNVLVTRHNVVSGTSDSGKDDYQDPGTTGKFTKYNGYFENQRLFKNNAALTFKGYLQITGNELLPSSEQFSLGGRSIVRGYKEGKLTGDQGYYLSLEAGAVPDSVPDNNVNYFIFLDHGGVYPYKGNEQQVNQDDYLTSTGQGFTVNFTEKITGSFTLGIPLAPEGSPRVHFVLQSTW